MSVFDGVTPHSSPSAASSSFNSHSLTGTNRFVLVGVGTGDGNTGSWKDVTGVDFGGAAMAQLGSQLVCNDRVSLEVFKLVNPPAGVSAVDIALAAAAIHGAVCKSFHTVDQTTPHGTPASDNTAAAGASVAVGSAVGELVADFLALINTGAPTEGADQTPRANFVFSGGDDSLAASTEPGAASVTMSWSWGATRANCLLAVSLKPATGGGAPDPPVITSPAESATVDGNLLIEWTHA